MKCEGWECNNEATHEYQGGRLCLKCMIQMQLEDGTIKEVC